MALIRIYPLIPRFYIPYQFVVGVLLSAISLLVLYYAFLNTSTGVINGNYIGLTFVLLSIAELFVSAIGLSMVGIYCDPKTMGFAMGAWVYSMLIIKLYYRSCKPSSSITERWCIHSYKCQYMRTIF